MKHEHVWKLVYRVVTALRRREVYRCSVRGCDEVGYPVPA